MVWISKVIEIWLGGLKTCHMVSFGVLYDFNNLCYDDCVCVVGFFFKEHIKDIHSSVAIVNLGQQAQFNF